jgi:anaerobic selenocysteine-containing dehydrogenase
MFTRVDFIMVYVDTVCPRDCYDTCFMRVLVGKDKNPISIIGDENSPITQGFLCPRGVADIRRTYSQERVLYPHKRIGNKPSGAFQRFSWDEALDMFAARLSKALKEFGSGSLLHLYYSGNMGLLTSSMPQRFFYALGFSQTDEAICSKSGHEALFLHYGSSYGIDLDSLPSMKLAVYWGFNAAVSAPHLHSLSVKAKAKGGSIVAIDPRQSETAKTADLWIQPKPGSDVSLAFGIMKHLIDKGLTDSGFIRKYTSGFDKLKDEIMGLKPENIERDTGVNWSAIGKLAELYASKKPSVTMIGIGMQKGLSGAESVRAVSLIPALVGLHRSFYYTNGRCWNIDNRYLTGESLTDKKIKMVSQVRLGKHLNQGEFKFVYIYNMNPAETLPNEQAVAEGLSRKDVFVVVNDTHWTQTARKYADLVLPAASFLEKDDVVPSYSHRHIRKSNKVVEPLGESKDEMWLTSQLSKRLNLPEDWLREGPWEALEKAMKDAFEDGEPSDLEQGKTLKLRMKAQTDYQTPTGKIEFYATNAAGLGVTPLPKLYPLPKVEGFILLNSATQKYTHTQFQDVYGPSPSIVLINPEDAKALSISRNDTIELVNDYGSIKLRAEISSSISKGVLWSPKECKDLDGKPQGTIMSDATQLIGGGSTYNSTIVSVRKK